MSAVAAYNTSKRDPEGNVFHPRDAGWVGYEVTVWGERLYHSGDTDVIPEMDAVTGVDVALLPVSGTYVMTAHEAAEAARRIQPRRGRPDALGLAHRHRGRRSRVRRQGDRAGADPREGRGLAARRARPQGGAANHEAEPGSDDHHELQPGERQRADRAGIGAGRVGLSGRRRRHAGR